MNWDERVTAAAAKQRLWLANLNAHLADEYLRWLDYDAAASAEKAAAHKVPWSTVKARRDALRPIVLELTAAGHTGRPLMAMLLKHPKLKNPKLKALKYNDRQTLRRDVRAL